jgi:hypothetical protein
MVPSGDIQGSLNVEFLLDVVGGLNVLPERYTGSCGRVPST